ncbi:hypothetical protein BpHYR1_028701, partial [Brachionus plicatilis]
GDDDDDEPEEAMIKNDNLFEEENLEDEFDESNMDPMENDEPGEDLTLKNFNPIARINRRKNNSKKSETNIEPQNEPDDDLDDQPFAESNVNQYKSQEMVMNLT